MLFKLFLTFLKINFLTTSGPASIGLTHKLIVPTFVSEEKFSEMVAIASGIPGSDAIQMAWQAGYTVKGWLGAIITVVGAMLPTVFLVSIVVFGVKFINPKILGRFFSGINPVLSVMLIFTAASLFPKGKLDLTVVFIVILSTAMFYFKLPVTLCLLVGGLLGVLAL